jgi:tetratricopeptide (TPR) repeat protein
MVDGPWLMVNGEADHPSTINHQPSTIPWCIAAIAACAIGMGVKEIMVSAPLLVLLYDGTFVSGSFRAALAQRWRLYLALCSTWLILFGIIGLRWKEATSDFAGINPLHYLITQPLVILYYLRLAVWPSPLVLAYGWGLEDQWPRIVLPALAILGLLAAMLHGLWRRRWYGFIAAWFFLILAPTSSVAPLRQALFEHRMYLPLASVVILAVLGVENAIRRVVRPATARAVLAGGVAVVVLLGLGGLTHARNQEYHSELGIWRDNVAHRPGSYDAQSNLGNVLLKLGRSREAILHYQHALRIKPKAAGAHLNQGNVLLALGRRQEAVEHYREAARLEPEVAKAHNNLGNALMELGRPQEAIEHYQRALEIRPADADAHNHLGVALQSAGRSQEGISHFEQALRLKPGSAEAHNNLANALLGLGRVAEAIEHYREGLRLAPGYAEAHFNLSLALQALGHNAEAIVHARQAVRLAPHDADSHRNLGDACKRSGRLAEAIRHFQQALRLRPASGEARAMMGDVRRMQEEDATRER